MSNNKLNNNELTHSGAGFRSNGKGGEAATIGSESFQLPLNFLLRNQIQASPFAFRVHGRPTFPAAVSALGQIYPHVLYDENRFGEAKSSKKASAINKRWRIYLQNKANGAIWMCDSEDGIDWKNAVQMDTALFPVDATKLKEGFQPFYDPKGLVKIAGKTYNWMAQARVDNNNTANATALMLYYSEDGKTWLRTAMANNTSNPFTEVPNTHPLGASFLGRTGGGSGAFNANLPRTLRNAPGEWVAVHRYATQPPTNFGDTLTGEMFMANNSAVEANYNQLGSFASWNRKLLRKTGENSYSQNTKNRIHHIVKFKDYYIGLVQLFDSVNSQPVFVKNGIGLAVSRDLLVFENIGPLYDAGLVRSWDDRLNKVTDTNGKTTAHDASAGNGDGSAIIAGSIVVDENGRAFGANDGGRSTGVSQFLRAYWTEETSGKILMGYL